MKHKPARGALEILKYVGPGFLVTIGFIDPGNWAANVAAGSSFGYHLLWVVTLSTIMLIILQYDAAHLGIVTGLCISEAATKYYRKWLSLIILISAMIASISTALAEILGAAIGLNMLLGLPIALGAGLATIVVVVMLFTNSYRKLERWIIGFVALIGFSFLYELLICDVRWGAAAEGWLLPSMPLGSLIIVMSILGAVVMPHNLFLHSEVIQSRQWNLKDERIIKKQISFALTDTMVAMIIGWAINSAMIIVAAAIFYAHGIEVTELQQAQATLKPLLGKMSAQVFAFALICAGIASSTTAALAGGSIFSGIFEEPFDVKDSHSRTGIILTLVCALLAIFFISDAFKALILSQVVLSMQLPITIFTLLFLTSSKKVMGGFVNTRLNIAINWMIGIIVTFLNITLLWKIAKG